MRKSSDGRRINIAVDAKPESSPPPAPIQPREPRFKTFLGQVLAWVCRPQALVALGILAVVAAAWAVVVRLRPPTIEGTPLPRARWKAISRTTPGGFFGKRSDDMTNPFAALDGNPQTHWTTNSPQCDTQWFAVDMKQPQHFHQVVMDAGSFIHDYPRGYAVYLSGDGVHWGSALASGQGSKPLTIVDLGPQKARYLKIVQTGQDRRESWSICELNVYEN